MIEIKVYSGKSLEEGAKIARSARLYVPGWNSMRCVFSSILEGRTEDAKIALGFKEGRAIGAAVISESDWGSGSLIQAFVRKSERRNKYGSQLVKKIKNKNCYALQGLSDGRSKAFWKFNKIDCE